MSLANTMILIVQTAVPVTPPAIIKQNGVGSSAVQQVLSHNPIQLGRDD